MAIEINPSTPSIPIPTVNGISVVWLGNWDNARVYRRNEGVFYNSSSYRANTTTTEEPSSTATDWDLLSQGTTVDDSTISNHIANTSNPHSTTAAQVGAIPTSEKGIVSGVATLDSGGKIPDTQIPDAIARDSELTAHTSNNSNPHFVTAAQIGNSAAQWNADKIQGVNVHTATPTNGQVLTYSTANSRYEPATPSGGSGGKILQTVHASINPSGIAAPASPTFLNTTLNASITPISASSFIQITGVLAGITKSTSVATNYFAVNVNDGTTSYTVTSNVGRRADAYPEAVPINIRVPATNTSTRTYTVAVLLNGTSWTLFFGTSTLTLMEIAP